MPQERRAGQNTASDVRRAPASDPRRKTGAPPARPQNRLTPQEEQARRAEARERAKKRQLEKERRLAAEKERARLRRERRKQLFRLSFIVGLVFVALYWGFVAFLITNRSSVSPDAVDLKVFLQGEKKATVSFDKEEICRGGEVYLPVSFLEKFFAVTTFGDDAQRSFMITETGEYATFTVGTCNVNINGIRCAVGANTFLEEDVLYIPVDFFVEKMNCFSFSYSSALACNVLTFSEEKEASFLFHEQEGTNPIPVESVPALPDPAAPAA